MAGRKRTRENRKAGKTCGAKTRNGTPCLRHLLGKGQKCPNHGGWSLNAADKRQITLETGRVFKETGPKTPEGRARSFAARDAGRDRYNRERRLAALAGTRRPSNQGDNDQEDGR